MSSIKHINTAHAVMVIVLTDVDSFVLIQESKDSCKGQWSLPGGMLEPGESIFDAGIREVYEEAGISIVPIGIMALEHFRYLSDTDQPIEKFRHLVIGRHVSGNLKDFSDAESLCAKTFTLQEATLLPMRNPKTIRWLEMASKGSSILPFDSYVFQKV